MIPIIKDLDFEGKKVLVRVDFNVPLDEDGNVKDDERIVSALPTIKFLLKKNAKIILMSHLGRPKGEVIEKLKMDEVAKKLSELVDKEVIKLDDCIGEQIKEKINTMKNQEIIMLENLRFHEEEEKNDEKFAKGLASLAEVYIDDAFANSHRNHASMTTITKFLPSYAGFLFEREIMVLTRIIHNPKKPFIVIIGGAKPDKIDVIRNLLNIADNITKDCMIGDIGPDTIALYKKTLKHANTVVWSGPLGAFEYEKFEGGTHEIALFLSGLKTNVIIGGGDSAAAINQLGLESDVTYTSTAGGAFLQFLSGKKLPAVKALEESAS